MLDLSNYTLVAMRYSDQLVYIHSGYAMTELVKAVTTGELNVALDFDQNGVMTTDDILKALGYFRENVEVSVGGSMEVTGTFSNAREIAVETISITNATETSTYNTPGFAFQWASWQDEQEVMDWEGLRSFRLVAPLIDSPDSATVELHYLRKPSQRYKFQ
jgi:hypothetical protein